MPIKRKKPPSSPLRKKSAALSPKPMQTVESAKRKHSPPSPSRKKAKSVVTSAPPTKTNPLPHSDKKRKIVNEKPEADESLKQPVAPIRLAESTDILKESPAPLEDNVEDEESLGLPNEVIMVAIIPDKESDGSKVKSIPKDNTEDEESTGLPDNEIVADNLEESQLPPSPPSTDDPFPEAEADV